MAFPEFDNWRFNPFTEVVNSLSITNEAHTIAYDADTNAYGFRLQEGVELTGSLPFNVNANYSIIEDITGGTTFTEVPRTSPPSAGQFRVDYSGATGYYGTSFIEFNASDNAKTMLVNYKGTGTVVKGRYQLEQTTVVPTNLGVEGALEITDTIKMSLGATIDEFSIDGTLAGNMDVALPTEQAVKTYVDNIWGRDVANLSYYVKVISVTLGAGGQIPSTAHGITGSIYTNSKVVGLYGVAIDTFNSRYNAMDQTTVGQGINIDDTNIGSQSAVGPGNAAANVVIIYIA